jgi:hypothetical protein
MDAYCRTSCSPAGDLNWVRLDQGREMRVPMDRDRGWRDLWLELHGRDSAAPRAGYTWDTSKVRPGGWGEGACLWVPEW